MASRPQDGIRGSRAWRAPTRRAPGGAARYGAASARRPPRRGFPPCVRRVTGEFPKRLLGLGRRAPLPTAAASTRRNSVCAWRMVRGDRPSAPSLAYSAPRSAAVRCRRRRFPTNERGCATFWVQRLRVHPAVQGRLHHFVGTGAIGLGAVLHNGIRSRCRTLTQQWPMANQRHEPLSEPQCGSLRSRYVEGIVATREPS